MAQSPVTRSHGLNLLIPYNPNPGAPRSKPHSTSPSSRYAMMFSLKQLRLITCCEAIVLIAVVLLTVIAHSKEVAGFKYSAAVVLLAMLAATTLTVKSMMYLRGPQGGKESLLKVACAMHIGGVFLVIIIFSILAHHFVSLLYREPPQRSVSPHWATVADLVATFLVIIIESVLGWIMHKMVTLYVMAITEKTEANEVEEA